MTELFLKLLGARTEDIVRVADASLALRGGLGLGWVLLLLLATGVIVYGIYRMSPDLLLAPQRFTLTALRLLFLALVLLLLLRPVLSLTVEGSVRRILVLLLDQSASMRIEDPRLEAADQKRAALVQGDLDPAKGLDQTLTLTARHRQVSRLRLVQEALRNESLNLLPRLDQEFDLAAFTFGDGLLEISARPQTSIAPGEDRAETTVASFPWVNTLTADRPVTALGNAIREVLHRKRGQPLAGIFLLSDGANNRGASPAELASFCRQEGWPLYVYGVGMTRPRDIILSGLFAPDVSFVKDEIPVTVRLRGQGLTGESAEVHLKLGDQIVARRTVAFDQEEEMVVPMAFTPQAEGEFDLVASVEPRPDETVSDNNIKSQRLKIIDARIQVLLVDQAPRWEFRYLQAILLRDRRVDLKCWLVEADKEVARVENTPYLEEFPTRKEDLFQYDLVVFGDVDPNAISTAQLENLSELVSRFGGAMILIAGKRFAPHAYRRGILEKMLPVEYESPTLQWEGEADADKPVQLQLTATGKNSPMLRLTENPEENARLWEALPPVFWVARVSRPKPAAEVLLVDPDPAKESRFGKMPVLAVQQYGLGQVLYVGTDNTWRWRKNVGDIYYTALWGQIAQRVSLQRLLGVSKRTQLTADRQNYLTGDRVHIYARLYSAGYDPVDEPSIQSSYGLQDGSGSRNQVTLRPVPEQPGLYQGEFIAPAAGPYRFIVENDPAQPLDFIVNEPQFEFGETAMNQSLLEEMANLSGGSFFREENLHNLPDTIKSRTDRVRSPLEVELWSSPLYFLLLLGVITAEWLLRKWWHLK